MTILSDLDRQRNNHDQSVAGPNYPRRLRLWAWLVARLPFLWRRFASTTDIPTMPARDEIFEAKLLAAMCQDDTRLAVQLILQGESLSTIETASTQNKEAGRALPPSRQANGGAA